jgi:hypothetical protein
MQLDAASPLLAVGAVSFPFARWTSRSDLTRRLMPFLRITHVATSARSIYENPNKVNVLDDAIFAGRLISGRTGYGGGVRAAIWSSGGQSRGPLGVCLPSESRVAAGCGYATPLISFLQQNSHSLATKKLDTVRDAA